MIGPELELLDVESLFKQAVSLMLSMARHADNDSDYEEDKDKNKNSKASEGKGYALRKKR